MSSANKLEVRRLLVSYEAASVGSQPTSGVARDAALGGLFIETTTPYPVGTLLTVELKSPKSDSLSVTLEARVFSTRKTAEGADRPAGMAVRFLDLPASMMMQLQSILEHHRPPARTQLGVGDEKDALWAAAGGRAQSSPGPDALAMAAAVVVDGRPTFDPLPPTPPPPEPEAPEAPRYPTPRMMQAAPISASNVSAAPPVPPSSQPSSLSAHTLASTPPSSSMSPPSFEHLQTVQSKPTNKVLILGILIAFVVLAIVVVIVVSRL